MGGKGKLTEVFDGQLAREEKIRYFIIDEQTHDGRPMATVIAIG
jgi:hypothetical protein